jgi:hypothetical protein
MIKKTLNKPDDNREDISYFLAMGCCNRGGDVLD